MNPRTPRQMRAAAALVAAGVLVLAACGGDDDAESNDGDEQEAAAERPLDERTSEFDTSPDDGILLLAAGKGDTIQLPQKYEVGQKATTTTEFGADINVDAAGQSLDAAIGFTMDATVEVTEVTEKSSTQETTIDSIDITEAPDEASESMEDVFDGVVGKTLVLEYNDDGSVAGDVALKDGGTLPDQLAQSFNQSSTHIEYPTEPVGVGAKWIGVTTVESNDLSLEAETTYELTELTADEYVVKITQNTPIDETVQGATLDGTLSGSGEARISRSNPAIMDVQYTQDADLEISGDGQSGDMTMQIDISMSSR